ncbi:MAG: hypothetical protein PF961_23770 [Planctomycetota bacterium]|nr:hypothetical protein [Planctomycetota bacterium]
MTWTHRNHFFVVVFTAFAFALALNGCQGKGEESKASVRDVSSQDVLNAYHLGRVEAALFMCDRLRQYHDALGDFRSADAFSGQLRAVFFQLGFEAVNMAAAGSVDAIIESNVDLSSAVEAALTSGGEEAFVALAQEGESLGDAYMSIMIIGPHGRSSWVSSPGGDFSIRVPKERIEDVMKLIRTKSQDTQ